ncbi:MAG: class I SAM-dependent methyltransferase [Rhodospirillales bacterium]|nr:class I SAM-dependent methyltransferase [Rhodospirillales bacterium]
MKFNKVARLTYNNGKCRCCDGVLKDILLLHTVPDRFEYASGIEVDGYAREWLRCERCGAATNIHSDDNFKKLMGLSASYYEVDYKGADIQSKYKTIMQLPDNQSDNAGRVRRVDSLYKQWTLREGERKSERILDIGAGTGVFLSKLLAVSTVKWDAYALEPDPSAAQHLRALDKFDVVEGLFTRDSQLGTFNLITLNKVLEHVLEPVQLLNSVALALSKNKGAVYVEVPDVRTIGHRQHNDNILGALHCHLYTPQTLEIMFKAAGLVSVQISRVMDPSGKITVFGFAVNPETYRRRAEE